MRARDQKHTGKKSNKTTKQLGKKGCKRGRSSRREPRARNLRAAWGSSRPLPGRGSAHSRRRWGTAGGARSGEAGRRGTGRRAWPGGVSQRRARAGHYRKGKEGREKKKKVIKVAAAAHGPTLPIGRLIGQTGGDRGRRPAAGTRTPRRCPAAQHGPRSPPPRPRSPGEWGGAARRRCAREGREGGAGRCAAAVSVADRRWKTALRPIAASPSGCPSAVGCAEPLGAVRWASGGFPVPWINCIYISA